MFAVSLNLAAGGGWSPLAFDPGTLFWTWVVFGVVCFILAKFVWTPLMGALEERERRIQGGLEEAEKAREEARRIQVEFEQQVKEARAEAKKMADEARESAGRVAATIETEARQRSDQLLERAREEIALAQRQAQEELRRTAVDLAILAAEKVIEKELGSDDQRRLAQGVIDSVSGG